MSVKQDRMKPPQKVKIVITVDGKPFETHECTDYVLGMKVKGKEGTSVSVGSSLQEMENILVNLLFSVAKTQPETALRIISRVSAEFFMVGAEESIIEQQMKKASENPDVIN